MSDPFASYSLGPNSPYSRGLPLTKASSGPIDTTRAIYCNAPSITLVAKLADDDQASTFELERATLYNFRIKEIVSISSSLSIPNTVPVVIGLY